MGDGLISAVADRCTYLNCTLDPNHDGHHFTPELPEDDIAKAKREHEQRVTEEVAARIATEQAQLGSGHLYLPMNGWAVREPPTQDPQKRNGDTVQSPWMAAFGIYASGHADKGLVFYFVLVLQADQTQALILHTPELQWTPLQIQALPNPADMRPVSQGA